MELALLGMTTAEIRFRSTTVTVTALAHRKALTLTRKTD
jgi:hypothetical protein